VSPLTGLGQRVEKRERGGVRWAPGALRHSVWCPSERPSLAT